MEGQLEEGMERLTTGIDGSNSRWGQYDVLFLAVLSDIAQEGRLTRACFSCEK